MNGFLCVCVCVSRRCEFQIRDQSISGRVDRGPLNVNESRGMRPEGLQMENIRSRTITDYMLSGRSALLYGKLVHF